MPNDYKLMKFNILYNTGFIKCSRNFSKVIGIVTIAVFVT